jgi:predicted DsbA family dithiol-disulfide isomerase
MSLTVEVFSDVICPWCYICQFVPQLRAEPLPSVVSLGR